MSERKVGVIHIVERDPLRASTVMTSAGTMLLVHGWKEVPGHPKRRGESAMELQVDVTCFDILGATREEMLAHRREGKSYPLPPPRPWSVGGTTYERLRVRLTEHATACAVALSDGSELAVSAVSVNFDLYGEDASPKLLLRLEPESYTFRTEQQEAAA